MTQQDRDRLVALKKARKGLITQRQAAEELDQSERHIRRLLKQLNAKGDAAFVHALRGRPSNRKLDEKTQRKALEILGRDVYRGFGPTLAAEYLASKHDIHAGRETVRTWMIEGKLWRANRQRVEKIHQWRPRRSRVGRVGAVGYQRARLAGGSWAEALLDQYDRRRLQPHSRAVRAAATLPKRICVCSGNTWSDMDGRSAITPTRRVCFKPRRRSPGTAKRYRGTSAIRYRPRRSDEPCGELDIVWIGAHSPQAKGRVERSFQTAQDRLVKGLRVAGAKTLEQANAYLETEFIVWWNNTIAVVPASSDDAHRPLGKEHSLAASLSYVENRQVSNDYTIQVDRQTWQIARGDIRAGLRGANVRVEVRLDGSMAVRFRQSYLVVNQCQPRPKVQIPRVTADRARKSAAPRAKSRWMENFHLTSPEKTALSVGVASPQVRGGKPIR